MESRTKVSLQGAPCPFCAEHVYDEPSAVVLGDLYYHTTCVPHCELCGRSLEPDLEPDWTYEALVVSSPRGYDRVPIRHMCAACRELVLLGEPVAQD